MTAKMRGYSAQALGSISPAPVYSYPAPRYYIPAPVYSYPARTWAYQPRRSDSYPVGCDPKKG